MRTLRWLLVPLLLLIACERKGNAQEQASTQPPPPEKPFALLTATRSDGPPIVVKVNVKTGQAWFRKTVDTAYAWEEIAEVSSPLRSSDYAFEIVVGKESWNLVRLDVRSGRGWGTESGQWKEYGASAAGAP